MKIIQICQEIKTLIKNILIADQEAKEIVDTSPLKAREAVTALREMIKEKDIATLQIKYSRNNRLYSFDNKDKWIIWSEEHGLGIQTQSKNQLSTVEPFVVTEGDYNIEDLVRHVHSQLQSTLNNIQRNNKSRKDYITQRNNELEQVLNCFKQLD